jgi:hypothetical protein
MIGEEVLRPLSPSSTQSEMITKAMNYRTSKAIAISVVFIIK